MSDDHPSETQPEVQPPTGVSATARLALRRAPRYRAFVLTGVVLGTAAGATVGMAAEPEAGYSTRAVVGYFALILGLVGALAGGAAALLADRRRQRRRRRP